MDASLDREHETNELLTESSSWWAIQMPHTGRGCGWPANMAGLPVIRSECSSLNAPIAATSSSTPATGASLHLATFKGTGPAPRPQPT